MSEFDLIPSDTSKVEGIAGNRTCDKCHQVKQWRQGKWVCLDHDNVVPQDWKHPQSGGLVVKGDITDEEFKKGQTGTIKIVKEEIVVREGIRPISQFTDRQCHNSFITIPHQAREQFSRLIIQHKDYESLMVKLSKEQVLALMTELEQMPTPTKMSDAKAIIQLIESLENLLKGDK